MGSTVVNVSNQTVGTIDDLIVAPNEKVPFAVLSVGAFLRLGMKYVVVPYSALEVRDNHVIAGKPALLTKEINHEQRKGQGQFWETHT